jgi:hypothetical protein
VPTELNDRFYPILLSRLEDPTTTGEIETFFRKLAALADAGIRKHERYVVIVTSNVLKVSPALRKQVAEVQRRILTPERNEVTLAAFVPIDNSFVRGAVTALGWIAPDMMQSVQVVASLQLALDEALRVLQANGTTFRGDRAALRSALGLPILKA